MAALVVGVPFRVLRRGGNGNDPAVVLTDDAPALSEAIEGQAETLVSDAERGSQLGAREGLRGEGGEDVGFEVGGGIVRQEGFLDDFEVGVVAVLESV